MATEMAEVSNQVNFGSWLGRLTCPEKSGQREYPMISGLVRKKRYGIQCPENIGPASTCLCMPLWSINIDAALPHVMVRKRYHSIIHVIDEWAVSTHVIVAARCRADTANGLHRNQQGRLHQAQYRGSEMTAALILSCQLCNITRKTCCSNH